MVGIRSFCFGMANFQVRTVSFRECISSEKKEGSLKNSPGSLSGPGLKGARLQVANLCDHFLRAFFATHVSKEGGPKTIKKKRLFFVWLLFSHKKKCPGGFFRLICFHA